MKRKYYIFDYIKLVFKRSITSIFLLADALGVIVLVLSFNLDGLPWYLSLVIFTLVFVVSCYSVWRDQLKVTENLQRKYDEITDEIPMYDIKAINLKQFDISRLITETESEIVKLNKTVKKSKEHEKDLEGRISFSSILSTTVVSALSASMRQGPTIGRLHDESDVDQLERLNKHLKRLNKYRESLKFIYFIDWNIQSTRSDKNIEIELVVGNAKKLILEDNFIVEKLPKKKAPEDSILNYYKPDFGQSNPINRNTVSYVDSKTGAAISKIKTLNAKRPMSVFDDEFYVHTEEASLDVKITIHSEKRYNSQIIEAEIDITNLQIEKI